MERANSKHGRQLDDELAREARAVTQGAPAGARLGGAPAPLTGAELEARSRLGRAVPRSALPGDRHVVLRAAADLGAEPEAIAELKRLPSGRTFATLYEIWEALGHRNETPQGQKPGRPAGAAVQSG